MHVLNSPFGVEGYIETINDLFIQSGSVSTPFTGTAYRVKYFKPIPKEIDQDTLTV